ncbi:hypothetical protein JTB14_031105 [Gonioctena quinquepunctata]|nr:hypothetical protein JTB14_031105 [Gonioctena quinquepunctata]
MAEPQKGGDGVAKPAVLQPTIIMKIDSPEEPNEKEIDDNEKNANSFNKEEIKMCSPFRSSTLSTSNNPFASTLNRTSRGILKPPQFSLNSSVTAPSGKPFVLKPSQLNPLANKSDNSDKPNSDKIDNSDKKSQFGFQRHPDMLSATHKSDTKTDGITKEKDAKSLSESAREYEETSRANKRKYEEVEVITGEEDENNILKISCKLFYFDKVSSGWQERGRGTLRLNDFEQEDHIGSRVVFRTTGNLRVIINTKIWAEMVIEKASEKSIRITALDANGEIKVFLIMSTIEDSTRLYSHLQSRLEREIFAQRRKKAHTLSDSDSKSN